MNLLLASEGGHARRRFRSTELTKQNIIVPEPDLELYFQ